MKLLLTAIIILFTLPAFTQWETESRPALRLHGGYAHDFPGLNGFTASVEYLQPVNSFMEVALGIKRSQLRGQPRTVLVDEYTKATSIDFAMYFRPLELDGHVLRLGAGYSFSFYEIKRSYPTFHNGSSEPTWPVVLQKGRASGITLSAEYQYNFPNSPLGIGVRGSLFKAYDHVLSVGPLLSYSF